MAGNPFNFWNDRRSDRHSEAVACEIWIKEQISAERADWLGVEVRHDADGSSVLSAILADQSALYGLLDRLRDLSLTLISVTCRKPDDLPGR